LASVVRFREKGKGELELVIPSLLTLVIPIVGELVILCVAALPANSAADEC